jgi:negative modulator of initiation of replication
MKTIEITDEVYTHLLRNVRFIGEDASSILKRLLGIAPQDELRSLRAPAHFSTQTANPAGPAPQQHSSDGIAEVLENPRYRIEREAVGKFLFVLSWLNQKHRETFDRVLTIRGRTRIYFAKTADDLERSGQSVNPQRIPNSEFWVVTNNDTPKKQRMLMDVMRLFGYGSADASRLADSIAA